MLTCFVNTESQKLPKCLHKWLFPPDGQTRDLPTLQVSLGSNNEFFVSDKLGKLSSRDPCCQAGEERPPPRMAQVARNVIRTKLYTVSNPTLPDDLHSKPTLPVIQRRRTLLDGEPSPRSDSRPSIASFGERPMLLRLDSRLEGSKAERRRSVFTGSPERTLLSRVDSRPEMRDIEEGKSASKASPMGGTATKQPGSNAETATLEKRKSIFSGGSSERPLLMRSDPKPEIPRLDELERVPIERIPETPIITRIEPAPEIARVRDEGGVSSEAHQYDHRGPNRRSSQ
jgi:hypothetical protein